MYQWQHPQVKVYMHPSQACHYPSPPPNGRFTFRYTCFIATPDILQAYNADEACAKSHAKDAPARPLYKAKKRQWKRTLPTTEGQLRARHILTLTGQWGYTMAAAQRALDNNGNHLWDALAELESRH
jgi:hypothetical protein